MVTRANISDRVRELVRIPEDKVNKVFVYDTLIDRIIEDYSKDRPYKKTHTRFGDATAVLPLPSDFYYGFSDIIDIEFPTGNTPRTFLDRDDDWTIERQGDTTQVLLLNDEPGTSEQIRITYTTMHTISTVNQADLGPLIYLACEAVCLAMAGFYANHSDPTLQGQIVNFRDMSQKYQELAKEWRNKYLASIGKAPGVEGGAVGAKASPPAYASKDMDLKSSLGRERIWHGGTNSPR